MHLKVAPQLETRVRKTVRHSEPLARPVEANRLAVDLANERYTRGLVDFLNVLESQCQLFISEDQLVQSERGIAVDLVALYKALGGGWEVLSQVS